MPPYAGSIKGRLYFKLTGKLTFYQFLTDIIHCPYSTLLDIFNEPRVRDVYEGISSPPWAMRFVVDESNDLINYVYVTV